MIHMTSTVPPSPGPASESWAVECRCGWRSSHHLSQSEARKAGDDHLADANAAENHLSPVTDDVWQPTLELRLALDSLTAREATFTSPPEQGTSTEVQLFLPREHWTTLDRPSWLAVTLHPAPGGLPR